MGHHARLWGMIAVALLLGGCAFFDVSLVQPVSALREKVVEGEGKPKILLLDITGLISERAHSGLVTEKPSMVAEVKESLQKAEKDDDIAGVILRINSPGGTVTASDIIRHELLEFKAHKKVPVYACIMGVGASGGYYVATAADRIFAHPTAVTGSIGVLLMRFEVDALLTKIGVSEYTVKSGDKKDMLSPFRKATPEEERIIQEVINRLYGRFLDVVEARPGNTLSRTELMKLADGRIYTADQALKAKLIDRIGYLDDVVAALEKARGIATARIITYYRPGTYRGTIYSEGPDVSGHAPGLVSLTGDGLEFMSESGFMYLWRP